MSNLQALKEAADKAETAFDAACRPHYVDGRWGYYRAVECGQKPPKTCETAFDAYWLATHAFYGARDGDKGFLGARGA